MGRLTQKDNELLNSKKDQSENLMIVDLLRNDLSINCEVGSIKVDELFPQVVITPLLLSAELLTNKNCQSSSSSGLRGFCMVGILNFILDGRLEAFFP